ncbi:catechol 2,3-dioxygenase-like lactoylglutathione lyase family enzyme [Streptomyces filamentosus]|uniref:VOC family protein n=1 Tax=Streptomyces filamentosus TaxID=67294 RepID=UPI0036E2797B
MFSGAHITLYSRDAEADRAFLRDVAGFPYVDAGRGWLVFRLPPAEVAVHPAPEEGSTRPEVYLTCEDLTRTLTALEDRGAEISRAITEERWGLLAAVRLPSGTELPLYEPRHPTAFDLPR